MSRHKPTLYLDTNILSVLHYRGGNVTSIARKIKTIDWWEKERKYFALVTSDRTEDELSQGVYRGKADALLAVRRLCFLAENSDVKRCAKIYLEQKLVPTSEIGDAIQLAFATIHRVDYLLTWNHAHLVKVEVQKRLESINEKNGWRSPWLVSPESIPWISYGQNIRRRDE